MKEKKQSKEKLDRDPYALISLPPSWFVVQQERGIEISVEALRMEQHPNKMTHNIFI